MIVKVDYFPNFTVVDRTFFWSCSCRSPENSIDSIETVYWYYSKYTYFIVVVVQLLSCVWLFMTAWTAAHQASLSFTISWSLLKWSPLSWWCHPTISSSVVPFSSCLQFFPTSVSFPMSWLFSSGGQCIGASASASVLPMNIQGWFPLRLTGLISLLPKGLPRVFSSPAIQKHQFFVIQLSLWSNSHIHTWLLEKP